MPGTGPPVWGNTILLRLRGLIKENCSNPPGDGSCSVPRWRACDPRLQGTNKTTFHPPAGPTVSGWSLCCSAAEDFSSSSSPSCVATITLCSCKNIEFGAVTAHENTRNGRLRSVKLNSILKRRRENKMETSLIFTIRNRVVGGHRRKLSMHSLNWR